MLDRTFAPLLDEHNRLRRPRKSIPTQRHGDCASMSLHPNHADRKPRLTCNCRHDADGQTQALEHRALLDVHFHIGAHAAWSCGMTPNVGIQGVQVTTRSEGLHVAP